VRAAGGLLRVCPDHGCDPRDGRHGAEPVPCLEWRPGRRAAPNGGSPLRTERAATSHRDGAPRLTERAIAGLPVTEITTAHGAAHMSSTPAGALA